MKTVCIVQCRMGSSRLPGKSLAQIAGKPMIAHVLERAQLIGCDEVVAALSMEPQDDVLAETIQSYGVRVVRPMRDANDVLGRYADTAKATEAGIVLRITGDSPLIDPYVSRLVLRRLFSVGHEVDYVACCQPEGTYADGLDTEAFYTAALYSTEWGSNDPAEREHVTTCMRKNYPCEYLHARVDQIGWKWSVDTKEDLEHVRCIFQHLPEGETSWEATRKAEVACL